MSFVRYFSTKDRKFKNINIDKEIINNLVNILKTKISENEGENVAVFNLIRGSCDTKSGSIIDFVYNITN